MPNEVLDSTRFLIENPKYVNINYKRLHEFTQELFGKTVEPLKWNFPEYVSGDDETVINGLMLGNSINFAFKNFRTGQPFSVYHDGQRFMGSSGMFASIKKAVEEGVPILDANYLANISRKDMEEIFRGNFEIPMLDERLKIFHEVGNVLDSRYMGSFVNLVHASRNRLFNEGSGFVEMLVKNFSSFDDSVVHRGRKFVFNKRAQLAGAMLYGRFQDTNLCQFEDINELTVFADYVVPTGLRKRDVLHYNGKLDDMINNGKMIRAGSRQELEIRASTIHACDAISRKLNLPAYLVDSLMWSTTRKLPNLKYFLVKTTNY